MTSAPVRSTGSNDERRTVHDPPGQRVCASRAGTVRVIVYLTTTLCQLSVFDHPPAKRDR
jgi:hypothetical protein